MKKLIKISLLAIIMLFFYATISKASIVQSGLTYGEKDSEGKVLVTITFRTEQPKNNADFRQAMENDGWTVTDEQMSKKIPLSNQLSFHSQVVGDPDTEEAEGMIYATPSEYLPNYTITLTNDILAVRSSNTSVATVDRTKITTVAPGKTMITVTSPNSAESIAFPLYVKGEESEEGKTSTGVDFSNGTYTINRYGVTVDDVEKVTNVYYKMDHTPIGAGSTESTEGLSGAIYNENENHYNLTPTNFNELLQTPGDIYLHLYEKNIDAPYIKFYDKKIERPAAPGINSFTDYTMSTHSRTQICFDLPYSIINGRKLTYKIGKIDDNDLLVAIRDGKPEGFTGLLDYAKNQTNPIINETVDTNSGLGYDTNDEIFPGNKLVDGGYYYLYALLEDENGRYIPVESVTLAMASVYPNLEEHPWYLFFYGSSDFNFDGVTDPTTPEEKEKENEKQEEKKQPSVLPKTGESLIYISLIAGTIIAAIVLHKKFKKI